MIIERYIFIFCNLSFNASMLFGIFDACLHIQSTETNILCTIVSIRDTANTPDISVL